MSELLDANVLVALAVTDHVHHHAAHRWWSGRAAEPFATCAITQGALLRLLIRGGAPLPTACGVLGALEASPAHEFWTDDISYSDVDFSGVLGHRQITDAYLAELARRHGGRLATFDAGLAALHPDVAVLLPVDAG